MQQEDAGLYQVRVEDVPVFSTELDPDCKELSYTYGRCNCNEKVVLAGSFLLGVDAKLSSKTWCNYRTRGLVAT